MIQTGEDNRPNLIELSKSKNLLIDGITLLNAPHFHLNVHDALNATIINVIIRVSIVYNTTTAATFPLNTGILHNFKVLFFYLLFSVKFKKRAQSDC